MSNKNQVEFARKVAHRVRITVPVVVVVEVADKKSYIRAQAAALDCIAEALQPSEPYSWSTVAIENSEMGSVKFEALALREVPELEEDPVPEPAN
jgi:hypothetical protein